jgi:hypothetical protein
MAVPETNSLKPAILLGESSFTRERLADILQRGGFTVSRGPQGGVPGALGLVELPGGPEVALLYAAGVRLVGIEVRRTAATRASWPFEELLHEGMSVEEILQRCNDVYFYGQGLRRHRRLAVEMDIKAISAGRVLLTTTVNFSRGGCFVRSLNPFAENSPVTLQLAQFSLYGEVKGKVLYTLRPLGDYIARPDSPEHPIIAHPGMAVEFLPGQEKTIDIWLTQAEKLLGT